MPRSLHLLAASAMVLMAGCASTKAEKPAVCDGKHRRPANIYGSVLPNIPLPGATAPAAKPGSGPSTSQTPPPPPGPMSELDPKSFEPCGRPA